MEDIFEDYLEKEAEPSGGGVYKQIALTASSYKNVDHSLKDEKTNNALATYGDALLNLACCKILFEEKVNNITEGKKVYVSDKSLVEIVAKHYDLLKFIRFDKGDENIPQDYDYKQLDNPKKNSPHKYIATAVEAFLAAIYLDNGEKFDLVVEIVKNWKKLIDKEQQQRHV